MPTLLGQLFKADFLSAMRFTAGILDMRTGLPEEKLQRIAPLSLESISREKYT